MLTSALRALVKNLVKESFYGKKKKKTISFLTNFFIFHKSDIKIFLKWILNRCPKGTCMTFLLYTNYNRSRLAIVEFFITKPVKVHQKETKGSHL